MLTNDKFLREVAKAKTVVIDLEANMLNAFDINSRILGYGIYLPDIDEGRYFPFHHGEGRFEVSYTERNSAVTPFSRMTWQGDTKRSIWINYWWANWYTDYGSGVFNNLPAEYEGYVQAAINESASKNALWIFHNAQFDMTWLKQKGMNISKNIRDTMIGMHIVHEDMGGVKFDAPFKWTKIDAANHYCAASQVGTWARDYDTGEPLVKSQFGNYQLKWLAAMLELDGALGGEEDMHTHAQRAKDAFADYICEHPDDPFNAGLTGKDFRETVLSKLSGLIDKKANMWTIPADGVNHYAVTDVKITWQLYQYVLDRCVAWNNTELLQKKCDTLRHVLWPAHFTGVHLNVKKAEGAIVSLENKRSVLLDYMRGVTVKKDFNPASPKQILEHFPLPMKAPIEEVLQARPLPAWWDAELRSGLTSYPDVQLTGTAEDALEPYAKHPLIVALMEYKKLGKAIGTYLERWIANRDGNGYLHPQYNITGTVSGRLSSSGDAGNFQNIPDRNGYTIKSAIVPFDDEWVIVGIDYGQLELRKACHIAEVELQLDKNMPMTRLFESGEDMHAYTRDAVNVKKVVYPKMTDEEICLKLGYDLTALPEDLPTPKVVVDFNCRFIAKTMNFGLLYGGGAKMLSILLGIDPEVAGVLVRAWRALYPAFQKANDHFNGLANEWRVMPNSPVKQQYVTMPDFGRHRRFTYYDERVEAINKEGHKIVWNEKENMTRKTWNNYVQGWGGEVTQDAALNIAMELGLECGSGDVHIFAIIHDAIDMYVRRSELDRVIELCKQLMTNYDVRPSLTVDVTVGENWQDMMKLAKWKAKQQV